MASCCHARVFGFVDLDRVFEQLQDALEFSVVSAGRIRQRTILGIFFLVLLTLVNQQSSITAIVNQQIAAISPWYRHHLFRTPPILWQSLPFPSENGCCACLRDRRGCVVLCAENIAR